MASDTESYQVLKHKVGDLVWAKVSGHPWWPCIVSRDTSDGNIFVKAVGTTRQKRMYFVEFFGPSTEYAWVSEGCLIEYCGIEAFKTYAQDQVDQAPTKSQKEKLAERFQLKVALTRREQWEQAVEEADEALDKKKSMPISKHGNDYDSDGENCKYPQTTKKH
jgi:histone-lysine N-methyltransferase NSD2